MNHDGNQLIPIELARPADDVILGVLVEIALPERVGVQAVKQLGDLVDAKLDDILRDICCNRDPQPLKERIRAR
jgi:hypothetical protein